MRLFVALIISAFLLSGCGDSQVNDLAQKTDDKKPKIPSYELKASVLDVDYTKYEIEDMENLLEEIDKDLDRPNITEEDIRRGWYLGGTDERKYGTPDSWTWQQAGSESKWISPNILEDKDYFEEKGLCTSTAGSYVISCLDTEIIDCEYVPETKCTCIEGTAWIHNQGCILQDDEEFVEINDEELQKGWYEGLPTGKKLNTPSSWGWIEAGQESKWQNPSSR